MEALRAHRSQVSPEAADQYLREWRRRDGPRIGVDGTEEAEVEFKRVPPQEGTCVGAGDRHAIHLATDPRVVFPPGRGM